MPSDRGHAGIKQLAKGSGARGTQPLGILGNQWERDSGPTAQLRAIPLELCGAKLWKQQHSTELRMVWEKKRADTTFVAIAEEDSLTTMSYSPFSFFLSFFFYSPFS